MKVESRTSKRAFRRTLRLRFLVKYNVALAVRLSDPNAGWEGFDKDHDTIISVAAHKITNPEWFDGMSFESHKRKSFRYDSDDLSLLVSEYVSNRDEVDKLINKATSNPHVNKWLTEYIRVQYYIKKDTDDSAGKRETEYWANRFAQLGNITEPITADDIKNLTSKAKRGLKFSRLTLSNRKAVKTPLNFEKVSSIIPVFSALLLISGFLYTYAFYKAFGIPIFLYSSVTDYVSTSIEQVYAVLFIVIIYIIVLSRGIQRASKKPKAIIEEKWKNSIHFRIIAWIWKWVWKKPSYFRIIVWILFLIFVLSLFFQDGINFYFSISMSLFLGGILAAPYLSTKLSNDRIRAIFVLFLVYSPIMNSVLYLDIKNALEGERFPKLCEQVNITLDKNEMRPPCGSPIIGATESHIFIFNKEETTTNALPRSQVTQGVFTSSRIEKILTTPPPNWLKNWLLSKKTQDETHETKDSDDAKKNQRVKLEEPPDTYNRQ